MRSARFLLSALASVSLMAAASAAMQSCLLPDFEVGTPPSPPPPDAGHEAAPMEPACGKTYPDPPGGPDMGANGGAVLAVQAIDMGEGEPVPPGYDLDATCTCFQDAGPSCVSSAGPHCDAPGGVDNGTAQLASEIALALGQNNFGSSFFSSEADQGGWSILIQVSGYNGMADDPDVQVAVFPSPGLMGVVPKWDGTDAWPVSPTSVTGGDVTKPVYVSAGAYVANHVLVAAIPEVPLIISGGTQTITIRVTNGVITGTLVGTGSELAISDGILAGRWAQEDIFGALSTYRSNGGQPFCTSNFLYGEARGVICGALDILANGAGVKSLPCDALSLGIGFKARPAMVGPVAKPTTPTPGCPPATDPASDSCFPDLDGGDGGDGG